jgi:hypothetical protein
VLTGVTWALNASLDGLRTHLLFFPLWLGYALAVDGWTFARTGTSPLARARRGWAALFLVSAPAWWLFELINRRLQNWEYHGGEELSDLEYFLYSSLAFSTVMPALLGTAELVRSGRWVERFARGPRVRATPFGMALCFAAGLAMLASMLAWPRVLYPFCWTSFVFLLEPVCWRLRRPALCDDLARGDWRPWISLWTAGLVCGFFWELWNVPSWPKWTYDTPGVDFWHVFEMPLLGYLGYLPFSLEVWLLAQLFAPGAARPRLGAREPQPRSATPSASRASSTDPG